MVTLSGDHDFQLVIEELAVGAQVTIPSVHVVVNNAYPGLISQSQRGVDVDCCGQLAVDDVSSPELDSCGIDHVKVAEGAGCRALRVLDPGEIVPAPQRARELMVEHRVPVVVEIILERITTVSTGTQIDGTVDFEELALAGVDAPTAIPVLD